MNNIETAEIRLTVNDVKAIEKVLNHKGVTEAIVKVEDGKIVVLQVDRKIIT